MTARVGGWGEAADVLCCAQCHAPLVIVCPNHGEHYTTERRVEATPVTSLERVRPGTIRARIIEAAGHDAAHGATVPEIAKACGITTTHASVELQKLVKRGLVVRVRWGHYARSAA